MTARKSRCTQARRRASTAGLLLQCVIQTSTVHYPINMDDASRDSASETAGSSGAVVLRLHPAGLDVAGVRLRSWMVFHSRLPSLACPDEGDGRAAVEFRVSRGDHWCHAIERAVKARGRRRETLAIQVVELPVVEDGHSWIDDSTPRVRLTEVSVPVSLHARLAGRAEGHSAPRRFLDHVRALEADGTCPAQLRPTFWAHVAAAVEMRLPLPWPSRADHSVTVGGGR